MNQSCLSIISSQSRSFLFTSESVSEGHPDKMADQISDRILDAFLKCDPKARVACETVLADQFVLVTGEFKATDPEAFDMVLAHAESIVRQTIRDIGYTSRENGIDPDECEIKIAFNHQSEHISQGVDQVDGIIGAGDQGLMFGYACDETPELMPLPISLAHKLVQEQSRLRKTGVLSWLRPDAKSQVSVRYVDGKPVAVEKVVLSTQHSPDISTKELRKVVREKIVEAVIPVELRSDNFEVLINPTGRFEVGGPNGDTGLTGRKIIVDTYGGSCPHGGGAFSGKDPSKVDRSAAYMARFIAKNIVAAGLATRCLVQLAYAISAVEPVSMMVDTYGTGKQPDADLELLVRDCFNLTPRGIIITFDLEQQTYAKTAAYGHFGRADLHLPWEEVVKGGLAEIKARKEIDINREYISSWLWRSRRTREPVDIKTYKYWPSYPIARINGMAAGALAWANDLKIDDNTTQDELLAELTEKVMVHKYVVRGGFIDWSELDRISIVKTTHPRFELWRYPHIRTYNCVLYFPNATKKSLIEEAVKIAATWCPTACAVLPPEKVIWPEED